MSIDMRVGGGRCPSLLVCGLLIALIICLGNWWTLCSTNSELLLQIDELNDQIKISVEERDDCETKKEDTDKKLKSFQDKDRINQVKLSQIEDTLTTCHAELKSFKQTEVSKEATLETLRLAKNAISERLNDEIDKNKKLEEESNKLKNELKSLQLTLNAPQLKPIPVLPIIRNYKHQSTPNSQLRPVELSAVEVSVEGQKGMKYHGIPILPQDPRGALRQTPRYSVTKIKSKLLEKTDDDNKIENVKVNQGAVNNTGNQIPNPQDAPEKDDNKDNNGGEVHVDNEVQPEINFNLISDTKNRDN